MRDPFVARVGDVLGADIAVPEHEREVRFYSRVRSTGEKPLWREKDLMNNLGMPIIGLGARTGWWRMSHRERRIREVRSATEPPVTTASRYASTSGSLVLRSSRHRCDGTESRTVVWLPVPSWITR
jgi:hypothetical protein